MSADSLRERYTPSEARKPPKVTVTGPEARVVSAIAGVAEAMAMTAAKYRMPRIFANFSSLFDCLPKACRRFLWAGFPAQFKMWPVVTAGSQAMIAPTLALARFKNLI